MLNLLSTPSVTVGAAVLVPLAAAIALRLRSGIPGRTLTVGAAAIALICSSLGTGLSPISWLAMTLFSGIALIAFVASPQRDQSARLQSDGLLILAGSLAVYATGNLAVVLAGWILSAVPMWRRPTETPSWTLWRVSLALGTTALAGAIGLVAYDAWRAGTAEPLMIASLSGVQMIDRNWILGLLAVAVITRKGVVPLHGSLVRACESGPLINTMLFMNGHLGFYLLARVAMPLMPVAVHQALIPLADLALLSAACTAVMALSETNTRRLLGYLSISQMSFLLIGLESSSDAGINGALIYWVLVSVSTCGLFVVIRSLEARLNIPLTLDRFHGLGGRMPRLAAFFLISSVALVGLPGTIGFVAEDLLFHGTLESHPELGLILPLATALNAITLLRMFSRIFFGRRVSTLPKIPDAVMRERWALTAGVAALVALGLRPDWLLTVTTAATQALVR